jgi:apolipoprotein N-acyltransferase
MGSMGADERSDRYYTIAACAIVSVAWLCWLVFGLRGWQDRLFLVSLTAVVGTIIWMAYLCRRDGDIRAWLPASIAGLGLLAQVALTLPEGPEHVSLMAYAGLAGAVAAWAVRLPARVVPATRKRPHPSAP